jgi:hypothetical protein
LGNLSKADGAVMADLDPIALAAAIAEATAKSKAQEPQGKTADLERQLGLTGRAAAQGAAGIVGLAYDPIAAVQNYLFGTETQPLREQVKRALTDLGVPEPETATERVIGAISEGAVGAGGQAAIARGAERVLTTGAQRIAGQLAAQPGAQAAAGGGGGGAAQVVAEAGGGPGAQLAAGLAGGIAGGRAAGTSIEAPSAALPAAVREAEDAGIRVMTSDVRQPATFAGKWLQRTGEMIPVAGTGGPRAGQQQERIDASVDLLRNYGVAEASAADNTIISSVTKDLLTRRGENLTKYTGMKNEVIDGLKDVGVVDVTRTVKAIDDEIASLRGLRSNAYEPVIARLEDWKKAITGTREISLPNGQKQTVVEGQPITNIEQLRKDVGAAFTAPELSSIRSTGEKALSRIYAPLREDMAEFIKANGQRRDFDKWNIANKQLAVMAGELELGALKGALAKGDATPEVIKKMLFSVNPSDIKALYRGLSAEGKRNARTAVLQEAFSKVGGNFENLSPDQFKRQLIRLGSPIGVFFSGQDLKAVEGLIRALRLTEQAGRAGVSTPTGERLGPPVLAAYLTQTLGDAGAALATGATIGGIARLYESAPVRNILLKLPQTTKGSPQEQELIKQLTVALRAEKAAEEQPQAAPQ